MAYATVVELQAVLQIPAPTALQQQAMERVLDAAAQEIDWDLGYTPEVPAPAPPDPLVVEVNLERAHEHWAQGQSPFGAIGIGSEALPVFATRDTWWRHHLKLTPLRTLQGIA